MQTSRITNKVIEGALDDVIRELEQQESDMHAMEARIMNLEMELELKDVQNDKIQQDMLALTDYVKELEDALAEAMLMSQPDVKDDAP